jgi:hypothetical protein
MNASRRAQFMVIWQWGEQVSLHALSLFLYWHRVFSFTLAFLFFSFSRLSLNSLWLLTHIPLCSITPCSLLAWHTMPFCNVLHYQVLPSLSKHIHIHQIVFVHMQRHAKERVDLSSVLHMHTHAHKIKSVHCAMINRLYKTVKVVFFYLLC